MFQTIKYLGAAYMLYLAWFMLRETGGFQFSQPDEKNQGLLKVAVKAVLINLFNPKLTIFSLAFPPIFVAPDSQSPMLFFFFC